MIEVATNFVEYFKDGREAALETLVRITFGTVLLWVASYSCSPCSTPACRSSDRADRDLAVAISVV